MAGTTHNGMEGVQEGRGEQPSARFALLRYFLATSILAVGAVMALTAYLFVQFARDGFARGLESQNNREAVRFSSIFYTDVLVPSREQIPEATLHDLDVAVLEVFSQRTSFGLPIVRISLFDLDGTVLYSTDSSAVSTSGAARSGFQRTILYKLPSSSLEGDQMVTTAGGTEHLIDVTTIFAPITDADPASSMEGGLLGVLEITRDITDDLARVGRTGITRALIASGSMGAALVVLLFLIVFRADRIIGHSHRQSIENQQLMVESNLRLEGAFAELKRT